MSIAAASLATLNFFCFTPSRKSASGYFWISSSTLGAAGSTSSSISVHSGAAAASQT
jgi:hypothetical protein